MAALQCRIVTKPPSLTLLIPNGLVEKSQQHSAPVVRYEATLCVGGWKVFFKVVIFITLELSLKRNMCVYFLHQGPNPNLNQNKDFWKCPCESKSSPYSWLISLWRGCRRAQARSLMILILTEWWLWGYFHCRRVRPSRRQEHDFVMFVMSEHWLIQRSLKRFSSCSSSKDARALCGSWTVE